MRAQIQKMIVVLVASAALPFAVIHSLPRALRKKRIPVPTSLRRVSCQLEAIDASLVPLWYRLPPKARHAIRALVKCLGRRFHLSA